MEVELKLKVDDPKEAERKISEVGEFLGERVEEDTYFNFDCEGGCCRDFAKTDEAVRLRKRDGECLLTYKGPKQPGEVKMREELEFSVGDCETATKFLEKLCLKPVITIVKRRKSWRVGDLTVTLDHVEGLGWFVEIEGIGKEKVEDVKALAERLFPGAERVEKTYLEMVLESLRK